MQSMGCMYMCTHMLSLSRCIILYITTSRAGNIPAYTIFHVLYSLFLLSIFTFKNSCSTCTMASTHQVLSVRWSELGCDTSNSDFCNFHLQEVSTGTTMTKQIQCRYWINEVNKETGLTHISNKSSPVARKRNVNAKRSPGGIASRMLVSLRKISRVQPCSGGSRM